MLPQRALTLISEYSKPMTRPDWKTYKPMTFNYYHSLINNSRINAVLKTYINKKNYIYSIDDLPFTLKVGQSYFARRITYTIINILPNFIIVLIDSNGDVHKGEAYIHYKNKLSNGSMRRMEGVYLRNHKIDLDQHNYIYNK
jgi:hypothetical protein